MLARTGLTKRLSEGNSRRIRSALATSFIKVLFAGSLALFIVGSRGMLSRIGFIGVLDLAGIDMAPVAGAFAALYLAPSKPQFGQSF
jgi:hypothetical protein